MSKWQYLNVGLESYIALGSHWYCVWTTIFSCNCNISISHKRSSDSLFNWCLRKQPHEEWEHLVVFCSRSLFIYCVTLWNSCNLSDPESPQMRIKMFSIQKYQKAFISYGPKQALQNEEWERITSNHHLYNDYGY